MEIPVNDLTSPIKPTAHREDELVRVVVSALRPQPRVAAAVELPGTGLLALGPRRLVVEPFEVAIVPLAGRLELLAAAGSLPEAARLDSHRARAMVLRRELTMYLAVTGWAPAGAAATLKLSAPIRLLAGGAGPEHPLVRAMHPPVGPGELCRAASECAGPVLAARLAEALRGASLPAALAGVVADASFRQELARRAGIALTGPLTVLGIGAATGRKAPAPTPPARRLDLRACWRVREPHGVASRPLGQAETLPRGALLDVAVAVSRDACIYVLLNGSSGRWQCLVPDLAGRQGLRRPNRQRAGESVVWPGANRLAPPLPFWALDGRAGRERFVVVASAQPVDLGAILSGGGDYAAVLAALAAAGGAVREMIVEHV